VQVSTATFDGRLIESLPVVDWNWFDSSLEAVMEVRLKIDDAFLSELQQKLGTRAKPVELIRDGLTMLRWAVDEAAAGRFVLSTNAVGEDVKRLLMQPLVQAEQTRAGEHAPSVPAEEEVSIPNSQFLD
jgi:hypothetical protein